jgi:hypothetical protein
MKLNPSNALSQHLSEVLSKSIPLKTGHIFGGTIAKIYPNDFAQIDFGGRAMLAKLETPLSLHEKYWFQVNGKDPKGVPVLNVIAQQKPSQSETILEKVGLTSSRNSPVVTQFLLDEQLPVTKGALTKINQWFEGLRETEQGLLAIKFMLMNKMPVTETIFRSLTAVQDRNPLTVGLQQLLSAIDSDKGLSQTLSEQTSRIKETLQQPFSVSQNIASLLKGLGLTLENELENHGRSAAMNSSETFLTSVKAALLQIQQHDLPHVVQERVEHLIYRLTGQQLLLTPDNSPMLQLYFQFPIRFGNLNSDAWMKWEGKRNKNGKIDENYCRILFYLQLEHLDKVMIDLQIQNRIITVSLYNDQTGLEPLIKSFQHLLKSRLKELNYQLSSITVKERNASAERSFQKATNLSRYSGVDIRI